MNVDNSVCYKELLKGHQSQRQLFGWCPSWLSTLSIVIVGVFLLLALLGTGESAWSWLRVALIAGLLLVTLCITANNMRVDSALKGLNEACVQAGVNQDTQGVIARYLLRTNPVAAPEVVLFCNSGESVQVKFNSVELSYKVEVV